MKGVVFAIFEDFITENWGIDMFEDLLDDCPHTAAEPFIGPKTYPDQWIVDLLTAACQRLQIEPPAALRAFGKFCFGGLASRFPELIANFKGPRELIAALHDIIHVEVKKLMDGAQPPNLICEDAEAEELVVHYESARALCMLAEGLLEGASGHFGQPIDFNQSACTHRGDPACTFKIRFPAPVPEPSA